MPPPGVACWHRRQRPGVADGAHARAQSVRLTTFVRDLEALGGDLNVGGALLGVPGGRHDRGRAQVRQVVGQAVEIHVHAHRHSVGHGAPNASRAQRRCVEDRGLTAPGGAPWCVFWTAGSSR